MFLAWRRLLSLYCESVCVCVCVYVHMQSLKVVLVVKVVSRSTYSGRKLIYCIPISYVLIF